MKDMDHDLKIDINQHVYKFTRFSYLVGSSVAKGKSLKYKGPLAENSVNFTSLFEVVEKKR